MLLTFASTDNVKRVHSLYAWITRYEWPCHKSRPRLIRPDSPLFNSPHRGASSLAPHSLAFSGLPIGVRLAPSTLVAVARRRRHWASLAVNGEWARELPLRARPPTRPRAPAVGGAKEVSSLNHVWILSLSALQVQRTRRVSASSSFVHGLAEQA